jgi:hypothetical protein
MKEKRQRMNPAFFFVVVFFLWAVELIIDL